MAPLEGETVGVGMPVVLYFSDPVVDGVPGRGRASGLGDLDAAGRGRVDWINDEELHWRPRELWPAGPR